MERFSETLDAMSCLERYRVTLAVFFLAGQAKKWWKAQKVTLGDNATSYNAFQKVFGEKYFSTTFQDSQRQLFIELNHVGMSVLEYINEFELLAGMFSDMVMPMRKNTNHLVRGLDRPIKR